jgi:hypothetical protein
MIDQRLDDDGGVGMSKKPKAKGPQKPAKGKVGEKAQSARPPGLDENRSKFERAFAKIAPPKGFAIKKP